MRRRFRDCAKHTVVLIDQNYFLYRLPGHKWYARMGLRSGKCQHFLFHQRNQGIEIVIHDDVIKELFSLNKKCEIILGIF